jgi:hypothetical protein
VDPDLHGSALIFVSWSRIRIKEGKSYQKSRRIKKEILSLQLLDNLFGGLEISTAWMSFMEAYGQINKPQVLVFKNRIFFICNILQFLVIQTLAAEPH